MNIKTNSGRIRRVTSLILVTVLVIMSVPFSVISYGANIGENLPVAEENGEALEESHKVDDGVAFAESCRVDDGVITVTAPAGVFPVGSKLQVKEIAGEDAEDIVDAVEEKQKENGKDGSDVMKKYLYDISIIYEGEEIEPNTEYGTPKISFTLDNAPEGMTGMEVYHIKEEKADGATDSEAQTGNEKATESDAATESEAATASETVTESEIATVIETAVSDALTVTESVSLSETATDSDADNEGFDANSEDTNATNSQTGEDISEENIIYLDDDVAIILDYDWLDGVVENDVNYESDTSYGIDNDTYAVDNSNDNSNSNTNSNSKDDAELDELKVEKLDGVSFEEDSNNEAVTITVECDSFSPFCLMALGSTPPIHMQFDSEGHALKVIDGVRITKGEQYDNNHSNVYRFCVYVETDYDTDGDGSKDLVKVFLQVPKAAADGDYKAPVIFDPTPYAAGTLKTANQNARSRGYRSNGFELENLYAVGDTNQNLATISTSDFALRDPYSWKTWYYTLPKASKQATNKKFYSSRGEYDYYIERGFAVAKACGIGTYGSEGFELCGLDLEQKAMACVVEWLAGDAERKAYTDRDFNDNTRQINAEWSNNNIAMTGCSYGGTLPFEVAVSGVKGLKTIIPFAGIASWYDYTNSQGMHLYSNPSYTDHLSIYNSGGCFEDSKMRDYKDDYIRYLGKISELETEADGNYTDIWEQMDYTQNPRINADCSALIVHGVNDFNVTTKHADLMYQTFYNANGKVRMILHQGAHTTLFNYWFKNGETFNDMVNRWLSYYLMDVKEADGNNILSDLAMVTWQDSNDPNVWHSEGKWRGTDNSFDYRQFDYVAPLVETDVITEDFEQYYKEYLREHGGNRENIWNNDRDPYYDGIPEAHSARYKMYFENTGNENTHIVGSPKIDVRISTPMIRESPMLTAVLIDKASGSQEFDSFVHHGAGQGIENENKTVGATKSSIFKMTSTKANVISKGWIDLENPVDHDSSENRNSYSSDLESRKPFTYYDYTIDMTPVAYSVPADHYLELVLFPWDPFQMGPKRPEDEEYPDASDSEAIDDGTSDEWYDEEFDYEDLTWDKYMFTIDTEATKIFLPLTASSKNIDYTAYEEKLDLEIESIEKNDANTHYRIKISNANPSHSLELQLKCETGPDYYKGNNFTSAEYTKSEGDGYYDIYIYDTVGDAFLAAGFGNAELSVYVKDDTDHVYGKVGFDYYIPHTHEEGRYFEEIPATEDTTGLMAHYLCDYDCGAWLDTYGIERDETYFVIEKKEKNESSYTPSRSYGLTYTGPGGTMENVGGRKRLKKYDGTYARNEWQRVSGKWYYFGDDTFARTGWLYDDKLWYFLSSDGSMATGWQKDGDFWYFLLPDGRMATGWVNDGKGNWYYMDPNAGKTMGKMMTGWITDPKTGYKYYLDPKTGKMVTGTVVIDGKTYYFTDNPFSGKPYGAL